MGFEELQKQLHDEAPSELLQRGGGLCSSDCTALHPGCSSAVCETAFSKSVCNLCVRCFSQISSK